MANPDGTNRPPAGLFPRDRGWPARRTEYFLGVGRSYATRGRGVFVFAVARSVVVPLRSIPSLRSLTLLTPPFSPRVSIDQIPSSRAGSLDASDDVSADDADAGAEAKASIPSNKGPAARANASESKSKSRAAAALEPEPGRAKGRAKFLRLDCEELARLCSSQTWSEEVVGCLNNYRHDLRRGVNPFEGAFPLWRNEQFRAATMSDDPNELERFAAVERAVMSAAEREETIALNARDAARGAAIDDDATRVTLGLSAPGPEEAGGRLPEAVVADAPEKESRAAAERTEVVDPNALATGLGEDDGEECAVEGEVAVEEGLREPEEEDEREEGRAGKRDESAKGARAAASEETRALDGDDAPTTGFDRGDDAAAGPVPGPGPGPGPAGGDAKEPSSGRFASSDPFLVAVAGAAAAHKGDRRPRSLALGRRWYDTTQYPTPAGVKPAGGARSEPDSGGARIGPAGGADPDSAPSNSGVNSGGTSAGGGTSGNSGGDAGSGGNSGSGSGDATTVAHFTRPPKLILYPDGSTREASAELAAAPPMPIAPPHRADLRDAAGAGYGGGGGGGGGGHHHTGYYFPQATPMGTFPQATYAMPPPPFDHASAAAAARFAGAGIPFAPLQSSAAAAAAAAQQHAASHHAAMAAAMAAGAGGGVMMPPPPHPHVAPGYPPHPHVMHALMQQAMAMAGGDPAAAAHIARYSFAAAAHPRQSGAPPPGSVGLGGETKPAGSDGDSDGAGAGSGGSAGGEGSGGSAGGSGGSGNTKGSGKSARSVGTSKGSDEDFTGVERTAAAAAVAGGAPSETRAVGSAPTKGRRSKRGGGNRANAQGASKRAKQKMDDAADCLQLLSEGFA